MARKTFCDRCGKEIKPRSLFRPNGKEYDVVLHYTLERYGLGTKRWELCYDCAKAVKLFLNDHKAYAAFGADQECDEKEEV